MQNEIKRRFARVLSKYSREYNPIFIKAAILDPTEFLTVDDSEYPIDEYLDDIIKKEQQKRQPQTNEPTYDAHLIDDNLTYREKLIAEKRRKAIENNMQNSEVKTREAIIQNYKEVMQSEHIQDMNYLEFWKKNENGFLVSF